MPAASSRRAKALYRPPCQPPRGPQSALGIIAPTMLERGDFKLDPKLLQTAGTARIRCPTCQWQPGAASTWYCISTGHPEHFHDGCGRGWNTFETRGRCPGCNYQWRHTSCLRCGGWALHEDWYDHGSGSQRPTSG